MTRPIATSRILEREFYQRNTEEVAAALLGKVVTRDGADGRVAVRLTEVEAYLGVEDPACHTFSGRRTSRTESMWGEAGRAYVYLVYGLHHCLNVVTVGPGRPEAVLLRGGEIIEGLDIARRRRGRKGAARDLAGGPGMLGQVLAVTRHDDGRDLCNPASPLAVFDDGVRIPESAVFRTPRIGVQYAGLAASWPLRFLVRDVRR